MVVVLPNYRGSVVLANLLNSTRLPPSAVAGVQTPRLMWFPSYDTAASAGETVVGAWGLNQVVSTYNGPVARIENTSDNTEMDVSVGDDGLLPIIAGTHRVARLYDQSGNGNDILQGTDFRRPLLVQGPDAINGRSAMRFDGINDFLRAETYSTSLDYLVSDPTMFISMAGRGGGESFGWIAGVPNIGGSHTSPFGRFAITRNSSNNSELFFRNGTAATLRTPEVNYASPTEGVICFMPEIGRVLTGAYNQTSDVGAVTYPNNTGLHLGGNGAGDENSTTEIENCVIVSGLADAAAGIAILDQINNKTLGSLNPSLSVSFEDNLVDLSENSHPVLLRGNASVASDGIDVGTGAVIIPSSGAGLVGDFTIDLDVYLSEYSVNGRLLYNKVGSSGWEIAIHDTDADEIMYISNSRLVPANYVVTNQGVLANLPLLTWVSLRIVRSGTDILIYVDNSLSVVGVATQEASYNSAKLFVGNNDALTQPFKGKIRRLQIRDGIVDTLAPVAYRWRVLSQDTGGQGMAEIQMSARFGFPTQTTGGTATASGVFSGSFPASNCFDGNIGTSWAGNGTAAGQWVEYEFTSPVEVTSVAITARSGADANQAPNQGSVQYFNGSVWVDYFAIDDDTVWASNERRTFTHPDFSEAAVPGGAHQYWRVLYQTITSGGASAAEIEFRPVSGGARLNPTTALASDAPFAGFAAAQAYDGNAGTAWASALATNGWIGGFYATATAVEEVLIQARSSNGEQCLLTGRLEYSDNGIDWLTEFQFEPQTLWGSNERRTFVRENFTEARFWELEFASVVGGPVISNLIDLKEVEFLVDAQDVTAGQTYSASSQFDANLSPDRAFDNSISTRWASATGLEKEYLRVEFGTPQLIQEISIRPEFATRAPSDFRLRNSVDGVTWKTVRAFNIPSGWFNGTRRLLAGALPSRLAEAVTTRYVRLDFTESNGDASNFVDLREVQFLQNGVNQAVGGTASASSSFEGSSAAKAFDGSTADADRWNTNILPATLTYDFGVVKTFDTISMLSFIAARGSRSFGLQTSPDGVNWTTVQRFRETDGWNTTKLFILSD